MSSISLVEEKRRELEQKRQELRAFEEQAQRQHEAMCLEFVKRAFEGKDAMFSERLESITIHPVDAFLNSNLHGGPTEKEFFNVKLKGDVKISGACTRGSYVGRMDLLVESPEFKFDLEGTTAYPVDSDIDNWSEVIFAPFFGLDPNTNTYDQAVMAVGNFWGHLQAALTIYMARMRRCPDENRRPPHQDTFTRLFAQLQTSE
uniref:Uncharacterized protein n=1 Tax=viral metagenome TaxID=1070528 RepID=A0A6C0BN17_9ZZZZ